MPVTIRAATAKDAESVASLGREFIAYLRSLGDLHAYCLSAEEYLRDGFGEHPAFSGLVAELDGRVVGYLVYCPSYDVDWRGRVLYISDVFVQENARRQGVARALMQEAATICRRLDGHELLWPVYPHNKMALAFYETLGAEPVRNVQYMHWSV
jgi:GNAT superfamily N-acetyltransferase